MQNDALPGCWSVWRPTSRLLVLLLSALFLQACSTTGTGQAKTTKVSAPEQCLLLAEPLPPLDDATLAGAVRNHLLAAAQYWELAERHHCLVMFEQGR